MTGSERWVPIVRRGRRRREDLRRICTPFILAERTPHQVDVNVRCSQDATSDARNGRGTGRVARAPGGFVVPRCGTGALNVITDV